MLRLKDYIFNGTKLTCVHFMEHAFTKKRDVLPFSARGCFLEEIDGNAGEYRIAVRGYDKFFNLGETPETNWDYIRKNCAGPFEVTLKENGCIIFVACVKGKVVVTSKHSFGSSNNETVSHADKGREWLGIHLKRRGRTEDELAVYLQTEDVTTVFEVAYVLISVGR